MLKKILTLSAALLITSSTYCWEPFTAPSDADSWKYAAIGWVQLKCPNCHELRLFPSEQFVIDRRIALTDREEIQMAMAICNYTYDIVPGRMCPFCGRNLPKN